MLSHTTVPTGSVHNVYPEAQRVAAADDGVDTGGSTHTSHMAENMTLTHQPVVIVRAEEALILIMVLILWIAAIALFFNRWGKIRMLEPYQPKFIQQHRPSCPLVDAIQQRSFSKFNLSGNDVVLAPSHHFLHHHHHHHHHQQHLGEHALRPRQNSVFVASSMVTLPMNPPRKVKSAFDLNNLVSSDPALNRSALRLNSIFDRDEMRRSSILPEHMRRSTDSRNNSICSATARNATLNVADNMERLPVKSGVLDFRRNSMLIINNLAEEISPIPFHRHFSLGGSNLNLTPDLPTSISPRRNSVIPPFAKFRPKTITTQKASKSLDCERTGQVSNIQNCESSLSSEALPANEYPKIVETRCPSPPPPAPPPPPQPVTTATCIDADSLCQTTHDNVSCSSQLNLLSNDQAYYSTHSAPSSVDTGQPLIQHRFRHSTYKVTNV